MANAKISQLTLIDAVSDSDLFAIVDDPSGSPITKKCTRAQLLATAELVARKNQASGYAGLDGSSLIDAAQIPTLALSKLTPATAGAQLIGKASGAGSWEEITVGSGLSFDGTTLEAAGGVAYGWDTLYPLTVPVDGDFSWENQGSAAIANTNNALLLSGPATAGDSLRIRRKTAPATPYTLTAYLQPLTGDQAADGATYGIGFRQSSDGKMHLFMLQQSASGSIYSIKFTNATTFSATYTSTAQSALNMRTLPINWVRIADNGTNRILSWSADGVTWVTFHTIGRTDFLTADQILFFVNAADASIATSMRLISWLEA